MMLMLSHMRNVKKQTASRANLSDAVFFFACVWLINHDRRVSRLQLCGLFVLKKRRITMKLILILKWQVFLINPFGNFVVVMHKFNQKKIYRDMLI